LSAQFKSSPQSVRVFWIAFKGSITCKFLKTLVIHENLNLVSAAKGLKAKLDGKLPMSAKHAIAELLHDFIVYQPMKNITFTRKSLAFHHRLI
jgi:hypothetical protein